MNSFSNGLAMVGEPFPKKNLIFYVLAKLDSKYTHCVSNQCKKNYLMTELQEILLSYDSRLEQLNTLVNNTSLNQPSINFSFKNSRN